MASKYDVGTVHETFKSGKVEVIGRPEPRKCLIKFLDTGATKTVYTSALQTGHIARDKKGVYDVGTLHATREYGMVEVIEYISRHARRIWFVGTKDVKVVYLPSLVSGRITNRPDGGLYGIGTVHSTIDSGDVEVISIIDTKVREIRFINTESTRFVKTDNIRSGEIIDWSLGRRRRVRRTTEQIKVDREAAIHC